MYLHEYHEKGPTAREHHTAIEMPHLEVPEDDAGQFIRGRLRGNTPIRRALSKHKNNARLREELMRKG
ncbi:hypothetical protein MCOR02_008148 [Pyricularia oryzae]|uniref:Uncharacterized protein n=3 Tax=Pyricularia oryzae TaxID=318829 RepID=G4N7U8_PYRO7|nr:uncharacterized protein MGG_17188 [Pyricularia oryzae 70-15]EHA50902.1 hypothetical protein MGG_17188 [Pyricularia oryzae 70-15]ELQ44176.1 hypothetical protein OOU_Y34scaffold00095g21 [Pyricularia oryzae Y34]KAH9430822.1 hypothetical protein MCOR02_008148 [Pyricularia oryzae]